MNNNNFTWNQETTNNLAHDAARDVRVVRPLLKLYGAQSGFAQQVIGHPIVSSQRDDDSGSLLSIPTNEFLTPVKLSCEFTLTEEQFTDTEALNTLAVEGANRIAVAEDALLLLGKNAYAFITELGVKAEPTLSQQIGLLPAASAEAQESQESKGAIKDRIVAGIAALQDNNRIGRYAAIVSLDLYQEAMKSRTNPMDAPIYEISPLLIKDGFKASQVLPYGTGVIFSQNGDGIKIAVPVDTSVELVEQKKAVFLRVVEQIRLVINIPESVVTL